MLSSIERTLSNRPCGLLLDIDGTISPIASRPEEASVSAECLAHVSDLTRRLDLVAVISGRPVRQARQMVGIEGIEYLGCHGIERLQDGRVVVSPGALRSREGVREYARLLHRRLRGQPEMDGLILEDKGFCITFHYRNCPNPELAGGRILHTIGQLDRPGAVRIVEARCAVELVPNIPSDKGLALRTLAADYRLAGLFYLGDDRTDISAFRALRNWRHQTAGRGLALAVAGPESPAELEQEADFSLPGVPGVERFLALLRQLLPAPSASSPTSANRAREEGPQPRLPLAEH